ncbi:MAG: response regulator [Fimbriimonadaceae bacterium]|nr:response regulator [Chthonomonadaceae bacterium]MCO5296772.1 response regulator [Fimbriimonadaceae bacterium]
MAEPKRILIIDDDLPIRRFLKASLDPVEYELIEAETGQQGIQATAMRNPQVVLLDLGLPDMDGVDVAKSLREWTQVPIIVLSARGQEKDKIDALEAGADDYLTKPFGMGELHARIRVALRRLGGGDAGEPVLETGGLRVDLAKRQVFRNGTEIHLTPNEYNLLAMLVRHAGRVVTHRQLLSEVWGPAYVEEGHYLRVYMGQLRHKLEDDPARPKLLINEPGVGYRLRV